MSELGLVTGRRAGEGPELGPVRSTRAGDRVRVRLRLQRSGNVPDAGEGGWDRCPKTR